MSDLNRIFVGLAGLAYIAFGVWIARHPVSEEKLFPHPPRVKLQQRPTYEQMTRWRTVGGYVVALVGVVWIVVATFFLGPN